MIELRKGYTNYLVEMWFKLMAIVPEKNWKDLAKELNSCFTYLVPGSQINRYSLFLIPMPVIMSNTMAMEGFGKACCDFIKKSQLNYLMGNFTH